MLSVISERNGLAKKGEVGYNIVTKKTKELQREMKKKEERDSRSDSVIYIIYEL